MPYLAAVRRSVTVFCSHVKLPGILTAWRASALITFSGEQAGSTEKWTAPAAEARKKTRLLSANLHSQRDKKSM
jgi:hypothetical protein